MSPGVPERLASIRGRIASACERAGRDPGDVVLVGAAKRQSEQRLTAAVSAGLEDFGENIVQEAEAHERLLNGERIRWHLIGPLQSNKARRAARLFDWVHSVDRLKIARRLDREAESLDKKLVGLVEVNLGDEASKHGFAPEELPRVADELLGFEQLRIAGVMAIPPPATQDDEARRWFRRLRGLRDDLFAGDDSRIGFLSMGMSSDFEIAIEEGATHVRIGSELFGPRASRS